MSEQKSKTSERLHLFAGAVTVAGLALIMTVDHMPSRIFAIVLGAASLGAELVFSEPARKKNADRKRRLNQLRQEYLRKERERLAEYESTQR